jgi:hypothetical protein
VALYTIAILLTLGVTFIWLAISHSRTTAMGRDEQQAKQLANAGLEIAMNYLSQGGSTISTSGADAGFRILAVSQSRFSGEDFADLGGSTVTGTFPFTITADVVTSDQVDSTLSQGLSGDVCLLRNQSRIAVTSNQNEGNREGSLEVVMKYISPGTTGAPPQYIIRCRSRIFKAGVTDNNNYIASRVVEYKIRRVAASDYMLFMQNARGWDAPGAAPPNSADKTHDCVGVPAAYQIDGDVRIEGDKVKSYDSNTNTYEYNSAGFDSNNATASEAAATPAGSDNRSGNLQFFDLSGNTGTKNDVKFTGTTSVARVDNAYAAGSSQEAIGKVYSGGTFQKWDSKYSGSRHQMGLPGSKGYLNELNTDGSVKNGSAYQNAGVRIKVSSDNGNAVFVDPDNPSASAGGDVEYNDPAKDATVGGQSVSHIPGFATVRIALNGKQLTVQKIGKYSGKVLYSKTYDNIDTDLTSKLIYVEGGNVQVSGNINGQLTIVAANNPERQPVRGASQSYTTYPNTIYTDWARQQQDAGGTPPFAHSYPGGVTRMEFPPPPQIATDGGKPVYVAREGNLTITGDVKYASGTMTPSSLGLIAKNYIYLNSHTNKATKELSVQGVLMSLDHSVQFDWDKNYSIKDTGWSEVKDGTFNLTGSIVSKYADVEGQYTGTTNSAGYIKQNFKHDPNLKYVQPPNFPQWARQQLLFVNYVILSYSDRGAVSAF